MPPRNSLPRLALLLVGILAAADPADKDYAAELPRIPPKEPAEATRQRIRRPGPGFRVETGRRRAARARPVAIDFDEDGRLFVAEFPEYNQYANKKPQARAASACSKTPTATAATTRAPSSPTTCRSAVRRRLLGRRRLRRRRAGPALPQGHRRRRQGRRAPDGLHRLRHDQAGEGMLNSFRWGLDNRFHVSTSLDGGNVRRAGAARGEAGVGPRPGLPASTRAARRSS